MNYREQFYEGEIEGKILLDVIDEKEAEAQALRDEPDWSGSKTLCSEMWKSPMLSKQDRLLIADGAIDFRNRVIANLREQLEALHARVVVIPDRRSMKFYAEERWPGLNVYRPDMLAQEWNACLDELALLNGKAVSEGLLRRVIDVENDDFMLAMNELRTLLGEGKEHE